MEPTVIIDSAAARLERSFAGELLRPGHPDYLEALRIHNAMFDRLAEFGLSG